MKYKTILCAVMLFVGTAAYAGDVEGKPKEFVRFDGKTFGLAWENSKPDEIVKEYIPDGEKIESWTKLASTREYPKFNDPMALASKLLETLKKQNSKAPSSMVQNQKTGEVMVDFIAMSPDSSFVEFNIFKYGPRSGGGVVAQQYALRAYTDIPTFLRGLKPERVRLLEIMATTGLQQGK
jgi:hypothetical protein